MTVTEVAPSSILAVEDPLVPVTAAQLIDRLGAEMKVMPSAATLLAETLKQTPIHQLTLCLVRNPKRVLANHRKEYDTLVRHLAWAGHPPHRALSPSPSEGSPPMSPSASMSPSSSTSSATFYSSLDEDLLGSVYVCKESGGVRTIRFPSLAKLLDTRRTLRTTFPRAFSVSELLRESLRAGHGRSIVPVADAFLVTRSGVDSYEVIRAEWYFQA